MVSGGVIFMNGIVMANIAFYSFNNENLDESAKEFCASWDTWVFSSGILSHPTKCQHFEEILRKLSKNFEGEHMGYQLVVNDSIELRMSA